ncbi:hypothetical protein B9T19_08390 [Ignatzschineria sp. F8392]|uniref:amidohydrolase n=1 Tax=Ignatzschineria sp. F8392 TaxID=1980117 RepID=UPI000B984AC2|nr:amidohydrolase [Ignatzschineria sp. F8392]OYQ78075.1 hypothetical protein B9T19_08390 [Ignatzschineria sp. F8392]
MIKEKIVLNINKNKDSLTIIAKKIWENPELFLEEFYASNLQKEYLKSHGFKIIEYENLPTAFMAEYGKEGPILGLLGEYDALKNLSQEASSHRNPLQENGAGHGCGHNLLGVGCIGAALAIKEQIEKGEIKGIIRYYGCPAEEVLIGKALMAKQGAFHDLDACLTWHPSSFTMPWAGSLLSMISAKFSFEGKSSHAGSAPHMGRSALSAVELMNTGTNYMREHIDEQSRIHYIITKGGIEPNTVPAQAEVWYNIRAPKREIADEIFQWLNDIAKGAALMTQTKISKVELVSGCYEVLTNQTLVKLIEQNMNTLGGPEYGDDARVFAKEISEKFTRSEKIKGLESNFIPLSFIDQYLHEKTSSPLDFDKYFKASTDVGDVSWITPTAMFGVATWPLGTAAHTWQTTAASGSSIGFSAMIFASKVMATTLVDLYQNEGLLNIVKDEFNKNTSGHVYNSIFDKKIEL